ncbi:MAG: hypothetical protein ACR2OJ_00580 [Hyphomicrobiales bacterium]
MKKRAFTALNCAKAAVGLYLTAVLCSTSALAALSELNVAHPTTGLPVIKLPANIGPQPEFTIVTRAAKASSIELAAQLSANGGKVTKPVQWTIYVEASEKPGSWRQFAHTLKPSPTIELPAGRYVVEIQYGLVRTARRITVNDNQHIDFTVNLNAGGLRVLSKLNGRPSPVLEAHHLIYKVGEQRPLGSLRQQGGVLRVPAGSYKIVSSYKFGNAQRTATARVTPGHLAAIELDHLAAEVQLSLAQPKHITSLAWVITDTQGNVIAVTQQRMPVLALKPGEYHATATVNGVGIEKRFSAHAGEKLHIKLNP